MGQETARPLTQTIFFGQPQEVDWAGVDYDGTLHFGKAINPRYTWAGEVWFGYKAIGPPQENSPYQPLTSLSREVSFISSEFFHLEDNVKHYEEKDFSSPAGKHRWYELCAMALRQPN